MTDNEQHLEHRYRRSFGWLAGYLPKNRAAVDEWHEELKASLSAAQGAPVHSPAVDGLARLIETDGVVRM